MFDFMGRAFFGLVAVGCEVLVPALGRRIGRTRMLSSGIGQAFARLAATRGSSHSR